VVSVPHYLRGHLATGDLTPGSGATGSESVPPIPGTVLQPGLVRERNGLRLDYEVRSESPTAALLKDFELNGSAPLANSWASVQADGLHIGVGRHQAGTWEGFFAVTRGACPVSSVFHVRMSREPRNVMSRSQTGEAVFAVQTGTTKRTGDINYVLVASATNAGSTRWEVGYAEGHIADATTTILWTAPPSPTAPVSQDMTLCTDGRSSYIVYFGNRVVYESNRLKMRIVPPFQLYLEVQALEISYHARFQDFWITSDDSILVTGLGQGDRVTLAPANGTPVRALADASGQARLSLAPPQAKGNGTLTILSGGSLRRFPELFYSGGDVYRIRG